MRYAVISDGIVSNIITADTRGADSLRAAGMHLVGTEKPVGIGDIYTDGKFCRGGEEVLTDFEALQKFIAIVEGRDV